MSVPSNSSSKSVHIVVQRYRSCKVLLQETEWVQIGSDETHCGLLVYVSFAQSCDKDAVRRAAQTALQLPVLTTGQWGDGVSETYSLLHLAKQQNASTSIILIPQANLISKVLYASRELYNSSFFCITHVASALLFHSKTGEKSRKVNSVPRAN